MITGDQGPLRAEERAKRATPATARLELSTSAPSHRCTPLPPPPRIRRPCSCLLRFQDDGDHQDDAVGQIQRCRDEAAVLMALDHPNILRCTAFFEHTSPVSLLTTLRSLGIVLPRVTWVSSRALEAAPSSPRAIVADRPAAQAEPSWQPRWILGPSSGSSGRCKRLATPDSAASSIKPCYGHRTPPSAARRTRPYWRDASDSNRSPQPAQ